jgi:hypothetical protein
MRVANCVWRIAESDARLLSNLSGISRIDPLDEAAVPRATPFEFQLGEFAKLREQTLLAIALEAIIDTSPCDRTAVTKRALRL